MVVIFGQLQFVELQKFHFLIYDFYQTKPIIVVPGSIPNMMRSFAKSFVFYYTKVT
jgi:hypothetical protein